MTRTETNKYRTVTVTARRGSQAPYRYTAVERVRRSKAVRVAHDTAFEVGQHETRSGDVRASVEYRETGAVVRVGDCKFVVRASEPSA